MIHPPADWISNCILTSDNVKPCSSFLGAFQAGVAGLAQADELNEVAATAIPSWEGRLHAIGYAAGVGKGAADPPLLALARSSSPPIAALEGT